MGPRGNHRIQTRSPPRWSACASSPGTRGGVPSRPLEAIDDVVADRARVLCVQRTGWGKSAVYFVATALLREAGAGPALIISPLLALMRNQIAAAERLGLRAHDQQHHRDDWDTVQGSCSAPERSTCC